MPLTPDAIVLWRYGFVQLNATIAFTWALMALLSVAAWLITRRLSLGTERSRWQGVVEVVVITIVRQIESVGLRDPERYVAFLGTLFLFVASASLFTIVPGYVPPTASLSTTAALALCVFVAVPGYGIAARGVGGYLKGYLQPSAFMLPFNLIGEASRTLALAVRLFGNMMSGTMIVGILVMISPFLFPAVMTLLGLLTGMVQAYIFSILAAVYIAAATQPRAPRRAPAPVPQEAP